MRTPHLWLAFTALIGLSAIAWAQTDAARGKASGQAVGARYGSAEAMEGLVYQPLQSNQKMQAMDGREFDAHVQCQAQQEFMRVSFAPSPAHDLQFVSVEIDRDLDGTREYSTIVPGPIAAVCTNGAIVCDPGTTANCHGRRWRSDAGTLVADDVPKDQLGGCYCFNDSCGAGLLGVNSSQVLGDLGSGIAAALQRDFPRLAIGSANPVDATTMQFYGQASGCGPDAHPEQYYASPEQIRTAGTAAAATPGTLYSRLTSSDVANETGRTERQCDVHRMIQLRDKPLDVGSVLAFNGGSNVTTTSCGTRCLDITVGRPGNNYYDANCGTDHDEAAWTILRPEMIESAVLTYLSYDDYFSVVFDDSQIVWSDPTGWNGTTQICSENDDRGPKSPNVDVTTYLQSKPAGSTWKWRNTTWWNDKGEGWAVLRVQFAEDCELEQESIDDACGALETNVQCTRRDESSDGVPVYRDYYATGLSPLPSSREFTRGSCRLALTRDYWGKRRTYVCEGSSRQFDASFSSERYQVVSSTFDPNTGRFDDVRTQPDGSQSHFSLTTSLPPAQDASCQRMCKTRKPRPGLAMGDGGSTGQLNPAAPAWDITYRDCSEADVCPLGVGEELVSACDCTSNFMQAVSIMQTIRMTAQDMQCNAP